MLRQSYCVTSALMVIGNHQNILHMVLLVREFVQRSMYYRHNLTPNGDVNADHMRSIIYHELADMDFNAWFENDNKYESGDWHFGNTYAAPNGATANTRLSNSKDYYYN